MPAHNRIRVEFSKREALRFLWGLTLLWLGLVLITPFAFFFQPIAVLIPMLAVFLPGVLLIVWVSERATKRSFGQNATSSQSYRVFQQLWSVNGIRTACHDLGLNWNRCKLTISGMAVVLAVSWFIGMGLSVQ